MKKRLTLLAVLFIIFSASFNIIYKVPPTVGATYVEGVITQDTIWTLVDSPFVLSNNVTVNPKATLTIEPGVEVRFGGGFSLLVNGAIIANGTEERNIQFTTNDPSLNTTWGTIDINGTQPSLFVNCIVEYGRNGTTLDNGSLDVENSTVRFNLENGIAMNGGNVAVRDSEMTNNSGDAIDIAGGNLVSIENNTFDSNGNGVLIAGGDQVGVQGNVITSDANGIVLTGNLTGTINIRQNKISLNSQDGMLLEPDTLSNPSITENNFTANNCGLFVSANASTYITRNYVSNNTVGMYYAGYANHQIYFNDIFENGHGVDVDPSYNATVNAAHNYWGDRTGPKHDSLNPHGTGNSVGGDGVDLTFIPFLTHSFTYNDQPPTATIWTDKVLVSPHQTITFVGTDSKANGSIYRYFFDFNDTENSGWTTLSLFNHSYSSIGTYNTSLTVEDDFGITSAPVFTTVNVADLTPLEVSATLTNSTISYNGETSVTVYVSTAIGPVGNANVKLLSVRGGAFSPQSGFTDANGYFTANFTAPNVTQVTDVRIIARASVNRYADGSDYKYVRVLPPLIVQVLPGSSTIESKEATTLTVYVTDGSGQPVSGANLALLCSNGTLSANGGTTDSNGSETLAFTAPLTLSQINVTVTATASKLEYADGQGEVNLSVEPRMLVVEVTANPDVILSEETATITAQVTSDSAPVANATVTLTSDLGGNFSTTIQLTDATGIARSAFTAPQTSSSDGINVTVTATAAKSEYLDGENEVVVVIKPKVLSVNIIPNSYTTYSQGKLNVTVSVKYENTSIQGATVTINPANGTFAQTEGVTGGSGNVTFIFTAPQVDEVTNVTFSAAASKAGYLNNTGQLNITVNPRTFGFQISPATLTSGKANQVSAYVTCKEEAVAVAGATVTISYGYGGPVTNVTDSAGTCTLIINTPPPPASQFNMTITLARSGYERRQANVIVNVVPEEEGFPWITMLLIAIPIGIVALLAVLIKMKLIVVSTKEETEEE